MFRNVLVPLDGSAFAEAALPFAVRIAKAAGGKVNLVMVHLPVAAFSSMGDLVVATPELELEMLNQDEAYLARTAAGTAALGRVTVGYREVDGRAGPEICQEATRVGADLVVMGTHGRGGFRRLWLGGVADYVVRHMAVPVLLVHPDQATPSPEPRATRRILVALDLSKESDAILEPAIALARVTGASLTLIHIAELAFAATTTGMSGLVTPDMELMDAVHSAAHARLEGTVEQIRGLGLTAEGSVQFGANAAEGLLDLLHKDEFDLIAMSTHGRGGMHRVLMGSVADQVIRGSTKPVLVLRPRL